MELPSVNRHTAHDRRLTNRLQTYSSQPPSYQQTSDYQPTYGHDSHLTNRRKAHNRRLTKRQQTYSS